MAGHLGYIAHGFREGERCQDIDPRPRIGLETHLLEAKHRAEVTPTCRAHLHPILRLHLKHVLLVYPSPLRKLSSRLVNSIGKMNFVEGLAPHFLQSLEVLQRHRLLVDGLGDAVDPLERLGEALSPQQLGFAITFSAQDVGLLVALGPQDGSLLLAVGDVDRRFTLTGRIQSRPPAAHARRSSGGSWRPGHPWEG